MRNSGQLFEQLVDIMAKLRSEDGCPWDREQTHASLRQYLLEETYEVLEAIDDDDKKELAKELGDVLLQVVFHAQIGKENSDFTIDTVLQQIIRKLIDRHPHVFGDAEMPTAEQQVKNWEQSKRQEGKISVLDGVPAALSALARAHRLQQKAATAGFDWPDISGVWEKIDEEMQELRHAIDTGKSREIEAEYGDLLFATVNLGRFIDQNPEDALRRTIEKFISRVQFIEKTLASNGVPVHEATLAQIDEIWEQAKRLEQEGGTPRRS